MPAPWEVVWFERKGGLRLGAITGGTVRRPTLVDEEGIVRDVPRARCLHSLRARLPRGPRVELAARLTELRARARDALDAETLWASLDDEVAYSLGDLAERVYGERGDDAVAGVVRALCEEKSGRLHPWFRLHKGRLLRVDEATRAAVAERLARRAQEEASHERFAAWFARWPEAGPPPPAPDPELAELQAGLFDYALRGAGAASARATRRLAARLGAADPDALLELLETRGAFPRHANALPHRKGLRREHGATARAEAARAAAAPPTGEDLTALPTAAIDEPGAHEVDDAISFWTEGGQAYLAVHIARLADRVLPGSALAEEMIARATSLYFPGEWWPLLPESLGEALSLVVDAERPALSLVCPVGSDGLPGPGRWVRSRVRVDAQSGYEAPEGLARELVRGLLPVAEALRAARLRAGARLPELAWLRVGLDEEGEPTTRLARNDAPAHLVVSELMVLYNARAAEALADAGWPALYRVQEEPLAPLAVDAGDPLFPLEVRRTLPPTQVRTMPGRQRSMGLEAYVQATSPLRRAADALVQAQLMALLAGGPPAFDAESLEDLRARLLRKERRARALEEERRRHLLAVWLSGQSEPLEAVVSRPGSPALVYLPALDREFPCVDAPATRGVRLRVRVRECEPRAGRVSFAPAAEE